MVAAARGFVWLVAALVLLAGPPPAAAARALILATTTSTYDSGLLDHLLPQFTAQTGVEVRAVVRGTGAALRLGVSGDADVLFVHDRAAEAAFVAAGHGALRKDVMASRFIIVGPRGDPANIAGASDAAAALARIAERQSVFVSRGDNSGTHNAERRLWDAAAIDPRARPATWYRETGSGMGATLNIAAALDAYALTDSATWANFGNRGGLAVLVDKALANPYGIILVNPARHAHILEDSARRFIDWLTGPDGQMVIDSFTIDGQHPFRSATATKISAK